MLYSSISFRISFISRKEKLTKRYGFNENPHEDLENEIKSIIFDVDESFDTDEENEDPSFIEDQQEDQEFIHEDETLPSKEFDKKYIYNVEKGEPIEIRE